MNDEKLIEKLERQKAWLINNIENFIEDFESVKIEIKNIDIDMLDENQINYLNGLIYGIGSIVNTLKNYTSLFYEGPHEDILDIIDLIKEKKGDVKNE